MRIEVTQEHIDKAKQILEINPYKEGFASQNCPVALALKDRFKVSFAQVSFFYINVGMFPEEVFVQRLDTPKEVINWIRDFDCRKTVQPFSFELELGEQQ